MKIELYRRTKVHRYTPAQKTKRRKELIWKLFILLAIPLIPATVVSFIWYLFVFKKDIHFDGEMENIVCAAWIPTFGILYSLLAANIFGTVWAEYKAMRTAVKRYDLETFIDLKDEELSPLVTAMMTLFSLAVLIAFMSMKYHTVTSGVMVIFSTTYPFSIIYVVISEIDDPCGGIWYIKHIPTEWLEIDSKKWRLKRHDEERKKFAAKLKENGIHFDEQKK